MVHKKKSTDVKYPLYDRMTRNEILQLADSLIGKQLWATHWHTNPYAQSLVELSAPQSKGVQYVSILRGGDILLHFKDCALPLSVYGEILFDTKERAASELAYLKRRDEI